MDPALTSENYKERFHQLLYLEEIRKVVLTSLSEIFVPHRYRGMGFFTTISINY